MPFDQDKLIIILNSFTNFFEAVFYLSFMKADHEPDKLKEGQSQQLIQKIKWQSQQNKCYFFIFFLISSSMLNRRKSIHSHSRPRLRLKSSNKENQKNLSKPKEPLMTIKPIQASKAPFKVRKLQKSCSRDCCSKKKINNVETIKQLELSRGISRISIQEKEGIFYPDNLLPQRADLDIISESLIQKLTEKHILRDFNGRFLMKKTDLLFVLKAVFAEEYLPQVRLSKVFSQLQNYQSAPEAPMTVRHTAKKQNYLQIESAFSLSYPLCDLDQQVNEKAFLDNYSPPSISRLISDKQKDNSRHKPLIKTHKNVVFTQFEDELEDFCIREESVSVEFRGDDELFRLLNLTDLQKFRNKHQQLLYTYINSQSDQLAKKYFKQYKNLQEQMLCYADLLRNRPEKGPSVNKTLPAINRLIDMNLDNAISRLSDQSIDKAKKIDLTKHLIYTIRRQYTGLVNELNQVVVEKAAQAREFQSKVTRWWDNHVFRKQLMTKLKDEYCSQLFSLFCTLKEFFLKVNEFPALRREVEHLMAFMVEGVKKMDECVLLGSNFY